MEIKKKVKKNETKTKIKQIKGTPFWYQQIDNNKFLTCGKVKLDVNIDISGKIEWEEFEKNNLWDLIALLCQAICNEIINNNNNNK